MFGSSLHFLRDDVIVAIDYRKAVHNFLGNTEMLLYKSKPIKQNFLQNTSKKKLHIHLSRLNVTKTEGLAV